MAIQIKKPLFKGPKAKPEVTRQGVRAQLGSFVYDLCVVANTPPDRTFTIGAGPVYIHRDIINFPETLVDLSTGTYQVAPFPIGNVARLLFTINQAGALVMYQGASVTPPTLPATILPPQKEKPILTVVVTSTTGAPGGINVVQQPDILQLAFADNRRSSLVVTNVADLATLLSPQPGDVVFVSSRNEFYFYNGTTASFQRVGNSTSGSVAIPLGATSLTVAFAQPLLTATYVVIPAFFNNLDINVQYQPMVVIAQTVNGFTVSWNAPTDTANYKLAFLTSIT